MALLLAIGAPQVHAQTPTDDWADNGGTVEVSETTLRIREGESATYRVRLTKPLPIDEDGMRVGGWWVMAQVDGATRIDGVYDRDDDGENDISWVPSVGWEFNPSDWPEGEDESNWREFHIRALQDDDMDDQTVTFSHEVWDQDAYCPDALHPDRLPVVTVHITDDDGTVSVPALSIADAAPVVEGVTSRFEVTLSASSAQVVTVDYATADGTAVEGADYTAVTGRTLRFEAGETAKTIEVATVEDGTQESTENFRVGARQESGDLPYGGIERALIGRFHGYRRIPTMPEAELTEPLDPAVEKGGFEERFAALEAAVGADVDAFLRRRSVNAQGFETLLQTVHRRALATASQVVKVVGGQRS